MTWTCSQSQSHFPHSLFWYYLLPCYDEINLINSLQPHRFLRLLSYRMLSWIHSCVGMATHT